MGFKHAAVLAPVSFFLGVLFICFNVDHKLLWLKLTDEMVQDGFQFYRTFYNSPPAIKALLHGMVGVGIIGLLAKLHSWDDSAMYFDGTCLGIYVFAIGIYGTVIIPMLRTVAVPLDIDSMEDRLEAMRVLSAANVIVVGCLVGILALQAGQEYARRSDEQEKQRVAAAAKKDE
ncbi:Shr3 amino acid permease chaperone [Mycena floridula]|nr:Shr3 amino acid permease chaperone [Mycena floridula]